MLYMGRRVLTVWGWGITVQSFEIAIYRVQGLRFHASVLSRFKVQGA